MKRFLSPFISISLLSLVSVAQADVLMEWKRVPLKIDLNTNEERLIFVDKNVQVGIPGELDNKLRVQSTGGVVYLKASEPFNTSRVQLRDIETGELILLDLYSREQQGKLEPVRIIYDDVATNSQQISQTSLSDEPQDSVNSASSLPVPAALTRYAAQSLYAPLRTVEPLPGVRRVAMKLPKSLPTLLPNLNVQNTPLESWGLEHYVVTAVRIKNLSTQRVILDPRYLQGYFYSATFQHDFLGAKGTPEDTTVVYLVTEGAPAKAFIPQVRMASTAKK